MAWNWAERPSEDRKTHPPSLLENFALSFAHHHQALDPFEVSEACCDTLGGVEDAPLAGNGGPQTQLFVDGHVGAFCSRWPCSVICGPKSEKNLESRSPKQDEAGNGARLFEDAPLFERRATFGREKLA